ncbi:hypothetical protein DID88_002279 [Monilinia fructigena]|uniref:non-specific serine/threonine protein kinase n=1 Tax=Monilinia fructigena TaxID=38457 RepID=A0A395IDD4_9HELO|nr:hypothetical protein DID88_002279 [Monilinia fructigena]
MTDADSDDMRWSHTDKVVEILGGEKCSGKAKQQLEEYFEKGKVQKQQAAEKAEKAKDSEDRRGGEPEKVSERRFMCVAAPIRARRWMDDTVDYVAAGIDEAREEDLERAVEEAKWQKQQAAEKAEKAKDSEEAEEAEEPEKVSGKKVDREVYDAPLMLWIIYGPFVNQPAPIRQNKWRTPIANLTPNNINIIEYEDSETPPEERGAPTPPLTRSEASKLTKKEIRERSLLTKRFNETKCYLQYIRACPPLICNLEAFFDLRKPGEIIGRETKLAYGHIFEFCDWGTLRDVITNYYNKPRWGKRDREGYYQFPKPKGMPDIYKHAAIPEAFIWHVYTQMMEGLAFLHGEHDLTQEQQVRRRTQIIVLDLKLDNVFLKSSGKPNTYPDVKIADFGESQYVEYGKSRWSSEGSSVYCISCRAFSYGAGETSKAWGWALYTSDRSAAPIWTAADPHLSETLCEELEIPIVIDVDERWTAGRIWKRIKPLAEARIPMLYRELQPWARQDIDIRFEEGYLERVENGGGLTESDEDRDTSDDAGGSHDSPRPAVTPNKQKQLEKQQPEKQSAKQPEKKMVKTSEVHSKKQREEEERDKENLSPLRPPKRRLTSSSR